LPLSNYDPEYGGKKGAAGKAHSAMVKEYGEKKGEQVFYATKNKRKTAMSARDGARALATSKD
jgi:hypothetical protein